MYRKKFNCRIEFGPCFLLCPKQMDDKGRQVAEKVTKSETGKVT